MKILFKTLFLVIVTLTLLFAETPYSFRKITSYATTLYWRDFDPDAGKYIEWTTDNEIEDIEAVNNDLVFIAASWYGISAFKYTGYSFILKAKSNDFIPSRKWDLKVASDSTVFVAGGREGLLVYKFTGSSLDLITHMDNGGEARGLALTSDSCVYLANNYGGLRKYKFNGDSLICMAHSNEFNNVLDVAVFNDEILMIACADSGIAVIKDMGSSFKTIDHINTSKLHDRICTTYARDVEINDKGVIFLADRKVLRAYTLQDSSLVELANVMGEYSFFDISISKTGTIFVACYETGLHAYRYDNYEFTRTAKCLPNFGDLKGVSVSEDGTVFTNTRFGIFYAYGYSGNEIDYLPYDFELIGNYPNPFNTSTTIKYKVKSKTDISIKIYNIIGEEIEEKILLDQSPGIYDFDWNAKDRYSNSLPSGVYIMCMKNEDHIETKKMLLLK